MIDDFEIIERYGRIFFQCYCSVSRRMERR